MDSYTVGMAMCLSNSTSSHKMMMACRRVCLTHKFESQHDVSVERNRIFIPPERIFWNDGK